MSMIENYIGKIIPFKKTPPPAWNFYESIDELPIWNWNMVNEKGDFTYLKKNRINGQVTKEEYANLKEQWEKLFADYIDRFKFSKNFLTIFDKKKEIMQWQKQYAETGDKSVFTFIKFAERELAELEKEKTGSDFLETKSILQQFLGYRIDAKLTSVAEFYTDLRRLQERNKRTT